MLRFIRSALHMLFLTVTVIPWSLTVVALSPFVSKQWLYGFCHVWVRMVVASARPLLGIRTRVRGLENLPAGPQAAAVLLVMAAHALAGTPLTLLHLLGLLLIVAVGSNYALFFNQNISSAQSEGGSAAALASLALANVSTLIGFSVLGLSQVPVLHAIGATVGPGALLALLLSMSWSARQPPACSPEKECA